MRSPPFSSYGAASATATGNPSAKNGERTFHPRANHHPTVKPTDLMRYLCRLVTPPGGTVLDPFAGSGSTGKACALEGFQFIGIEREAEYVEIARARIAHAELRTHLPAKRKASRILDPARRRSTVDGQQDLFMGDA